MGDENTERLVRLEKDVTEIQKDVTEIKGVLTRLEPMLMEMFKAQATLIGRVADMPTARDFGHLEGRLEEISRRLPTTIGYTPPRSAAG